MQQSRFHREKVVDRARVDRPTAALRLCVWDGARAGCHALESVRDCNCDSPSRATSCYSASVLAGNQTPDTHDISTELTLQSSRTLSSSRHFSFTSDPS